MPQMAIKIFCCICLFISVQSSYAQKVDSIMKIYSGDFQQEKLHLHFDKTVYNPGETIWYKAYLFAGNLPSDISTNLYMDWYDRDGNLLSHVSAPVIGSTAKSQFDIPAGYKGSQLHLKVYTSWMLNFDNDFIYEKYITVAQAQNATAPNLVPETRMQFFPEGGDLVNGLTARVAFKAVIANGTPVEVKGLVRSNKGEVVDSFFSEHDGMGSFTITALKGETYTASWKDAYGRNDSMLLPAAKSSGVIMQAKPLASRDIILIKRSPDATDDMKMLHLVAHMHQEPVFTATADLRTKTNITAQIPTGSFPSGVLQITLFNANWVPVAERVVFVNNHEYELESSITLTQKTIQKRGMNIIDISVGDTVFADLSVAVADFDVSRGADNIVSQLLLNADIKGYVHDPAYYFSGEDDAIDANLDLVMLTHGWRRYKWEEIVKGKLPVIRFPKETQFIELLGTVQNASSLKIADKEAFVALLQGKKDSGQHIFGLPLSGGRFSQSSLSFFDTVKFMYRFPQNDRFTEKADVVVKTNLLPTPGIAWKKPLNLATPYDSAALINSLRFAAEQEKMYKSRKGNFLPDVVVKNRVRRNVDILDEMYVSPLFKDDGFQFDVQNDPKYSPGISLYDYILGKVPGLTILTDTNNTLPRPVWRLKRTDIYLDEIYQEIESARNIQMSDVAYIKVLRPGTSAGRSNGSHFGGAPGGIISVYSKKGLSPIEITPNTFKTRLIEGYTAYKEFYSPDYSTPADQGIIDARTTLYWNPSIKTDALNQKVTIQFYNNDYSKKLRVILEGMNADGRLTHIEKIIE